MRHYELTVELLAWHEAGHAADDAAPDPDWTPQGWMRFTRHV